MRLLLWFLLTLQLIFVPLNIWKLVTHKAQPLSIPAVVTGSAAIVALSIAIHARRDFK